MILGQKLIQTHLLNKTFLEKHHYNLIHIIKSIL